MTVLEERDARTRNARLDFLTWERTQEDIDSAEHQARLEKLRREAGAVLAPSVYIAAEAAVYTDRLVMGEQSWIAGHALVRGDVEFGAHCTVNPYACISGRVRCGDGVRIASHASIVGFNHGFDDLEQPIYRQPHKSRGIVIEDDVWIGANAVIVDGATVRQGVVVAAGAVVTGEVPAFSVVAGVPARVVRRRGETTRATVAPTGNAERELRALGSRADAQWRDVLASYMQPDGYISAEADGIPRPSVRHLCDAIEIAAGFGDLPPGLDVKATVVQLREVQDPPTGLFPDPMQPPPPQLPLREDGLALYNVLAVGYALELLGSSPRYPVRAVELKAEALCAWLESLPWQRRAWSAGAAVDAIGTALYLNARYFSGGRSRETLFGWLALNADRVTGLWGRSTAGEGLLQPVNGFYRLTRGTYAQFGLPVPHPERAIDSVLANYREYGGFSGATYTACNLLDTVHPLWLCLKQTDHRRSEAEAVAHAVIARAGQRWQDGRGFPFADGQQPSLQGTEMWLSVLHLAARLLRLEHEFTFRPRGVHRTEAVGLGY